MQEPVNIKHETVDNNNPLPSPISDTKISNSTPKKIIVIAGPTAVGKTAIAIEVAKRLNTVILSADSRQCYKELNIGVARPSAEELAAVPHYFIASHSIHQKIDAAFYENYSLGLLQNLFEKNDRVVVTGGTGLYIKALTEGLDDIPEVPASIREAVIQNYSAKGIEWLRQTLQQKDALYAASGEMQNPQRMMRALEVVEATGQSIISFRNKSKKPRDFEIVQIALEMPRQELYERINRRVNIMMERGLEAEARSLLQHRQLNALQTVGYREMFDYFDGTVSLPQTADLIKQNTRHYAKRQMTWFKKQADINWVPVDANASIQNTASAIIDFLK